MDAITNLPVWGPPRQNDEVHLLLVSSQLLHAG